MNLTFAEILALKNCPAHFSGDPQLLGQTIQQVEIDSRKIGADSLFIAIRGERSDGHQFINEALQRGARAAVIDTVSLPQIQAANPAAPVFVVQNTTQALQEIAHYYRQKFSIPVIGLTGTAGKTTTKEMIGTVLASRYQVLKTTGNLNNQFGVPLTLFQLTPAHTVALIEMGTNSFGEIRRLTEITNPNYGLITNIGRGHLEFLGSLEGVAREKTELFQAVAEQGSAFVNVDDPFLLDYLPRLMRSIRYGIKNTAEVQGKFLGVNQRGATRFQVFDQEISLRVPGMHNIYNALAAISVGLEFGLPLSQMKSLLEAFESHSKRLQVIEHQGITILNDCYNANPDSMEAALAVLNSIQVPGRKLAVVADMLELGAVASAEHRQVGQKMAQMPLDYVLGYGTFTLELVNTVRKNSMIVAEHFTDKTQLIQTLLTRIQSGDLVLIKGSRGMAMEAVTQALLEWQGSPVLVQGN